MMSIADANSVITATAPDNGKIQLPELSKPLKVWFGRKQRGRWMKKKFNLKAKISEIYILRSIILLLLS